MDEAFKRFAKNVHETLNSIEGIDGVPVADRPVSLEDADLFNVSGSWLGNEEIAEARRTLASAISSEKWMDGAKAAIMLIKLLG